MPYSDDHSRENPEAFLHRHAEGEAEPNTWSRCWQIQHDAQKKGWEGLPMRRPCGRCDLQGGWSQMGRGCFHGMAALEGGCSAPGTAHWFGKLLLGHVRAPESLGRATTRVDAASEGSPPGAWQVHRRVARRRRHAGTECAPTGRPYQTQARADGRLPTAVFRAGGVPTLMMERETCLPLVPWLFQVTGHGTISKSRPTFWLPPSPSA